MNTTPPPTVPTAVPLTARCQCSAYAAPNFEASVTVILSPGTTALYDPTPTVGECIDGNYMWYRLIGPTSGFVHFSCLEPV
jgi:hypothetical protein